VIRRLGLIVFTALMLLLVVAAGLMTAFFVFRHPTPAEFQEATVDQPVQFPGDEAAHFDAQTEWWYYTGFLTGADDLRYGFELVFFKVYLPPEVRLWGVLPLYWSDNPLYFAHFALSDQAAQEHVFFERVNSPEFWEAGARGDRFEVHQGDWRAWGDDGEHHLRASGGRYALRLDLEAVKPPALHGPEGAGVIQMGQAGTSYYYSEPELTGTGLLYVDGVYQPVLASAWMDHQWGSWQGHDGYAGWDWFSLRLDDDNQVMLFEFRDGGQVQPESGGTWIAADGSTEPLAAGDYAVEVLERWTSPETGGSYPVKWQVTVPDHDLDVVVEATFPEQELPIGLGPIYWEGTVTVSGSATGDGFVEMTGYVPADDQ
jgi:predicted secreted hydrolase